MKIVMINVDSDHLGGNFSTVTRNVFFHWIIIVTSLRLDPNKFIKSLSNVPILGSKLVKDICFRVQVV